MAVLEEISVQLQAGKVKDVKALVQQALDEGIPAADILKNGLLAGMDVVGEKFKNNEVFVPEVLIAARCMSKGTEILKPFLQEGNATTKGTVVIGTVSGDLHDIGKNLVRMMMEGKGLEVIDLGVDVKPEQFVEAAKEHNADIISLSALLTTTMPEMKNVVDAVKAAGLKCKVMVGGAPVTEEFCVQVGADKYTEDATSAAEAAVALIG